jgi:hypothetical protein
VAIDNNRDKNTPPRRRKVWPVVVLVLALAVNIIWIAALGYSIFRLLLVALG